MRLTGAGAAGRREGSAARLRLVRSAIISMLVAGLRVYSLVIAMAIATASCSGASPPTDVRNVETDHAESATEQPEQVNPNGDDALTYGRQWLNKLPETMRQASAYQAVLLQDGLLTLDEHEQALGDYLRCIERNGGRVTDVSRDESGRLTLLGVGRAGDPLGDAGPVVDSCRDEHYSYIEYAYWVALHFGETEATQLARVAACVAGRGYPVPPHPATFGELMTAAEALDGPQPVGHHGAARTAVSGCNDDVQ